VPFARRKKEPSKPNSRPTEATVRSRFPYGEALACSRRGRAVLSSESMLDPAFAERRRRVLARMGSSVLVVFAAPLTIRNNDVEYEYRQDSDFYYLTGFDEPDAVLVLSGVHPEKFVLFVRPRDPERES